MKRSQKKSLKHAIDILQRIESENSITSNEHSRPHYKVISVYCAIAHNPELITHDPELFETCVTRIGQISGFTDLQNWKNLPEAERRPLEESLNNLIYFSQASPLIELCKIISVNNPEYLKSTLDSFDLLLDFFKDREAAKEDVTFPPNGSIKYLCEAYSAIAIKYPEHTPRILESLSDVALTHSKKHMRDAAMPEISKIACTLLPRMNSESPAFKDLSDYVTDIFQTIFEKDPSAQMRSRAYVHSAKIKGLLAGIATIPAPSMGALVPTASMGPQQDAVTIYSPHAPPLKLSRPTGPVFG